MRSGTAAAFKGLAKLGGMPIALQAYDATVTAHRRERHSCQIAKRIRSAILLKLLDIINRGLRPPPTQPRRKTMIKLKTVYDQYKDNWDLLAEIDRPNVAEAAKYFYTFPDMERAIGYSSSTVKKWAKRQNNVSSRSDRMAAHWLAAQGKNEKAKHEPADEGDTQMMLVIKPRASADKVRARSAHHHLTGMRMRPRSSPTIPACRHLTRCLRTKVTRK
jgi:hypothetical protein